MSNIASSGDGAELRKKSMWGNKTSNNLQEHQQKTIQMAHRHSAML